MASLDLLRAVAVFLVIGRHVKYPLDAGWGPIGETVMRTWTRGGWVGVDLFFVLSGFLVSGLLFREYQHKGTISIGRFLIRRGLKIYPAFYFLLAVTVVQTVSRKGTSAISLPAVVAECLFVQNYGPSMLQHSWSLAVEEHFYLLCSLLIFFLTQEPSAGIPTGRFPDLSGRGALQRLGANH